MSFDKALINKNIRESVIRITKPLFINKYHYLEILSVYLHTRQNRTLN